VSLKAAISAASSLAIVAIAMWGAMSSKTEKHSDVSVYDDCACTDFVETTMQKLDELYLEFYSVDALTSGTARREFLQTVTELMQSMNGRFDQLDPKAGAALDPQKHS